MEVARKQLEIEDDRLSGRLVTPATGVPAVLFVHGWGGSQQRDTERAKALSQLGFVSFTFDLRGHGDSSNDLQSVTRQDGLHDLCLAYDFLAAQPQVDKSSIAVVGSSYGAYLATILTSFRFVRWLGLRVPALYRDKDWLMPKALLDRDDLTDYRSSLVAEPNRALDACEKFAGDVLIVESEYDDRVPHTAIASYMRAFVSAHSITYRIIAGADHALTTPDSRRNYSILLSRWLREMIFGAR